MISPAPAASPFNYVRRWNAEREEKGWWHTFELPDGTIVQGVCPLESLRDRISKFPIAQNLAGRRVLDIGTWDGWFAFEMERRGAEVLAIDNWDNPRFRDMHARLASRVEYRQMDVYELTPQTVGYFDIVLFMGVLYHLKHPLLALERVCALTRNLAAVDSFVLREKHLAGANLAGRPIMEFYETDEFGGQTDNWVGPSLECLMAFCRTAGFARVDHSAMLEHNASLACYRSWEDPPAGASEGPQLLSVFHDRNFGINFNSQKDEYMNAVFETTAGALTIPDVKPEVSGYGVRPIHLRPLENKHWEATFKLPPGLQPGLHELRLRMGDSAPGNAHKIAVDMALEVGSIQITSLADGSTWKPDQLDLSHGDVLSLWANGLPDNADKTNVQVYIDAQPCLVTYVEQPGEVRSEPHQINASVNPQLRPGQSIVELEIAGIRSESKPLTVLA